MRVEAAIWMIAGSLALMSLCALACAVVSVYNAMRSKSAPAEIRKLYAGSRAAGDASAARYERAREFIAFKTGGGDDD